MGEMAKDAESKSLVVRFVNTLLGKGVGSHEVGGGKVRSTIGLRQLWLVARPLSFLHILIQLLIPFLISEGSELKSVFQF